MTTPDSQWMAALEDRLGRVDDRLQRGDERMGRIESGLADNTAVTNEVRDILAAAKGAFRFLGGLGTVATWLGKLAAAGLALWGAIYAMTHGGRPPGGH